MHSEEDFSDLIGDEPRSAPVPRDELGRFPKGVSGNPTGRPRDTIARLARERGPDALQVLANIMADPQISPKDRIAAAEAVLARGFGKPIQPSAETDLDGNDKSRSGLSAETLLALGNLVDKLDQRRAVGEVIDVTPRVPHSPEMIEAARRIAFLGYMARKRLHETPPEQKSEQSPLQAQSDAAE